MVSEQLVVFRLGNEEYAVSISQVKEIVSYGGATRLPNTPEYLEGIINLRGNVIPVINLAKQFGMARGNEKGTQVVIVEAAGREVGVVVDVVSEVLRIDSSAIEPAQTVQHVGEFLRGIGKLDGRLIIILELDKLFSDEEQALLTAV